LTWYFGGQRNAREEVALEDEFDFGFTLSRLAWVFGVELKDVKRFMKDVEPDDTRNGQSIWRIPTAAPYLMSLENVDIEPRLRKMRPSDLPPSLQKEVWTALNLRQKYYKDRGDTWATGRVYEVVTSIEKIVRNTAQLFVSSLDGRIDLSAKVRDALQAEMDKMQREIKDRIIDEFSDYDPTKDHGDNLELVYGSSPATSDPSAGRRTEILGVNGDAEEDDSWLDDL
jgi:hypothetical protein